MKQVVAVLISFLLVITTIPIYAFAETITGNYGVLSYEIIDGEVTIIDCDSNAEGEIVIPSIIDSCPVVSIGDRAFSNCKKLNDISLSQNCVTIGDWAFFNCSSISSIIIPNSVTDLGYGAFQGCSQLERITVGSGLIDVDLYCLDDFSEINNYECSNLKEIIIDESNPSYSSIDGVLFDKTNQELIYYPRGREGEYTLPNTTRKIRSNAFRGCSKLTKLNTLEGLTEIGDSAFSGSSISSFVIPNSVNVIGTDAFQECDVLDSITLGDNVSYIYSGTFAYCDNLSEINISASVESITISALYYCPKLKSINVDSNNGNYLSIDGVLFNKNGTTLLKCPEGREGEYIIPNSVVNIKTCAFDKCENITKIIFISSVIEIGTYAFRDCDNLIIVCKEGSTAHQYAESNSNSYKLIPDAPERPELQEKTDTTVTLCNDEVYEYSNDKIHWQSSNIFTGLQPNTEYNFYRRIAESNEFYYSDPSEALKVVTYKATVSAPEAPQIQGTDIHSIILVAIDGYEYRCNDGQWQVSPYFDNLAHNTTYTFYQRIAEGEENYVSASSIGTSVKTLDKTKNDTVPIEPVVYEIKADSIALVDYGYEYSIDGINWQSSSVFNDLTPNTTYTLYQRSAETETAYPSEASVGLQVTTKKVFIVTYDANGGSDAPAPQIKTEEVVIKLSTKEPVRSGYIFTGWSTTADGNVTYSGGDEYAADSDIVLYAKWIKICTNCEGTGEYGKTEMCDNCDGEGVVHTVCSNCNVYGQIQKSRQCTACNGSCFIGINVCYLCDGTGMETYYEKCRSCGGDRDIEHDCDSCNGGGTKYNIYTCGMCGGTGIVKGLERIEITQLPEKLTFLEGKDELSVIGGKITLYYDDNTSQMMDIIPSMITGFDNTIVGSQTLTVIYNGKTATYNIEIISKELESIELIDNGLKKEYLEGKDQLNITNGTIRLHYNNGTYSDIALTAGMVSGFNNTVVGEQILTVTYSNFTDSYNIEIIAKTLESIEVTTLPNKTNYLVGKDSFSAEGGKVTLYYNNDTSDIIDLNSSMVSGFSNQTVGVKTLTVTYKGKTDTFNITVDEKTLTSISVTAKPNKLSYLEGESFSKTGLVVTAYYDNDTSAAVSNYSISGYSTTPGTKTITVTYNGKTDTFTVTVLAKSLSSIAVTTKPSKLTYTEGEAFDKSGMVVTAYYNNNTSGVVTDYTVSGYTSTPGTKTITVTYGGKNATFTVTVKSGVPQSVTSSKFTISGNKISKISAGTTVSALLNGISEGSYCKVYNGNSVVSGNSNVGTGMVVKIMDGNTVKASYTVIVTGDTNGDGNITVTDMIAIKAHVLKKSTLSGVYATAADTNGDSGISITDFIQVKAKILGKGSITAR